MRRAALCALLVTVALVPVDRPRHHRLFVGPGPEHGFHPMPRSEVVTFVTDSGLELYVPKERGRCWDAPLPCTPYPKPDLRLRREGDLRSGFVKSASSTTRSADRPASGDRDGEAN
jgi:hypothetical protein